LAAGEFWLSSLSVIWFTSIWKARNDKLKKDVVLENIIESVKRCSWNWLRFKENSMNYNMNQWFVNPRACPKMPNVIVNHILFMLCSKVKLT